MFIYGKTAANAIAVMSFLATDPTKRAGSGEIARARKISPMLTAKLLTQLAAAGLVSGQSGPGGGYKLAKSAGKIFLIDIISIFEQTTPPTLCPYGHDWCGQGDPCPLHDAMAAMIAESRHFTEKTSLSVFEGAVPTKGSKTTRVKKIAV